MSVTISLEYIPKEGSLDLRGCSSSNIPSVATLPCKEVYNTLQCMKTYAALYLGQHPVLPDILVCTSLEV